MGRLLHLFPNQDSHNTIAGVLLTPFAVILFLWIVAWVWETVAHRRGYKPGRPEHDCASCPLCSGGWTDQCSEYQAAYGDPKREIPAGAWLLGAENGKPYCRPLGGDK